MLLENELEFRLFFFAGILVAVALWEALYPKRQRQIPLRFRWFRNLILVVLNSMIVRLVVPFTAVGVALYVEQHQIGLFHKVTLPGSLPLILSLLVLDFFIYLQHVIFHHVPLFWRLHKVHHIDQEIDVTTGLRFHPGEIILSVLFKGAIVAIFGISASAVVIFEIILNATAMFNHGNIALPKKLDQLLRILVVTPDMHRVHHSVAPNETNRNFGFNLPWWDRIFKTYQDQPQAGHDKMEIGLAEFRSVYKTGLGALLIIPFLKRDN